MHPVWSRGRLYRGGGPLHPRARRALQPEKPSAPSGTASSAWRSPCWRRSSGRGQCHWLILLMILIGGGGGGRGAARADDADARAGRGLPQPVGLAAVFIGLNADVEAGARGAGRCATGQTETLSGFAATLAHKTPVELPHHAGRGVSRHPDRRHHLHRLDRRLWQTRGRASSPRR